MSHFNISNFSVFPLFPSTFGATIITEDLSNLNQIKNLKFEATEATSETNNCYTSESRRVFSNLPEEKNIIMSYFNKFKNDVLRFETTNFEMTTSWATKLTNNASSQFHLHKNSYYSGVVYLESVENGGEIEFDGVGLKPDSFMVNSPTEYNTFNYGTWHVKPQKNLIIFFPSYLRHRIKPYFGNSPRYSIAFNIVPVGEYGGGDSSVNISLNIS
jgi:uncharacterized protein (TIGR02466 family)